MRALFILSLVAITACAPAPPFTGAVDPLLYDADDLASADKIAIFVPGALASVQIFAPAEHWRDQGYALVYYRYPGYDGLPLDHALGIENAAARIAALASRYPDKPIRLLGYSTGGPIAIRAAEQLRGDVRVAAMSPAVERGGGLLTGLHAGHDVLLAAAVAGSFRESRIWREYYRILLFGRNSLRDRDLMAEADSILGPDEDSITAPPAGLTRAHTRDLRRWTLDTSPRLPPEHLRLFIGMEDSLFSTGQTIRFARNFGDVTILGYPDQGHLLFESYPPVFDDILAFFEE